MSNGVNNRIREIAGKSLFESALNLIGSSTSWLQGDLLILDTTTHLLRKPATEAECASFAGIAVQTIVNGKVPSPVQGTQTDAAEGNTDIKGPVYGDIFQLTLKTGSTLHPGDLVYGDPTDGTNVVQASGTEPIGVYQGDQGTISSSAAGLQIMVLIGAQAPTNILTF